MDPVIQFSFRYQSVTEDWDFDVDQGVQCYPWGYWSCTEDYAVFRGILNESRPHTWLWYVPPAATGYRHYPQA